MKSYIDSLYQDGVGKDVTGYYFEQPFMGQITSMRPLAGGGLRVYVKLESTIYIKGDPRDSLALDGEEIFNGGRGLTRNLHAYL
jgi:hypothetical protein